MRDSVRRKHVELNVKLKRARVFLCASANVKDESSPFKGGHQSDDEGWNNPPPKPPRIRR